MDQLAPKFILIRKNYSHGSGGRAARNRLGQFLDRKIDDRKMEELKIVIDHFLDLPVRLSNLSLCEAQSSRLCRFPVAVMG